MALCRIKNPEQLKKHPPGELGKLLGLDRVPEVGYLRKKIRQVIDQSKTDLLHTELFHSWVTEMPEMFFYIDGHVRVYHGEKANLPKRNSVPIYNSEVDLRNSRDLNYESIGGLNLSEIVYNRIVKILRSKKSS